ncbi:uncharacterized protein TEOVI_000054000 [Trypanosoma equiperdum]|uniref:Uncharacterized protein n=1 Tax=Trypanosoma equiperdum TaxID=5694 RepID=A0A1G4I9G9_TRYEQ|nr:hypothetical protein, conserved [Trypanosoma equiperdum]
MASHNEYLDIMAFNPKKAGDLYVQTVSCDDAAHLSVQEYLQKALNEVDGRILGIPKQEQSGEDLCGEEELDYCALWHCLENRLVVSMYVRQGLT